MTLAILFSLKTMGSLENGLQPHSGVTPLFAKRRESLASSQCWLWRLVEMALKDASLSQVWIDHKRDLMHLRLDDCRLQEESWLNKLNVHFSYWNLSYLNINLMRRVNRCVNYVNINNKQSCKYKQTNKQHVLVAKLSSVIIFLCSHGEIKKQLCKSSSMCVT